MKYKHTNIIAKDWRALVRFYEEVFECVQVPPERHMAGEWLSQGTGVPGAAIDGVHLRLPGGGEAGPTLEVFQYARNESGPAPAANREGFSHIAFEVDDVAAALVERGIVPPDLRVEQPTLEDVFLKLTGHTAGE